MTQFPLFARIKDMHDQLHPDINRLIESMSDAEKRELIERVENSMRQFSNRDSAKLVELQKQTFHHLSKSVAQLSPTIDPYAVLGHSNEAHDQILYDLEQS